MKTLQDSIKYTLEKKKYQLSNKEHFFTSSNDSIVAYLKNEKSAASIALNFDFLATWDHFQFIHFFLDSHNLEYRYLAESTITEIEANNWYFFLGKKVDRFDSSIQFHEAIKHMAQALLLGWDTLAIKYGKLLITMLYGKQYKGWHPIYKHPWFMLEIFCKWQNIKLDYSKLQYPENMEVYKEVIDNWDTESISLLSTLVNKLVDFHIAQSDEYVTTDEYGNEESSDFSSSDYFIYAVEILLWLNIRSRMGLPEYTPNNELMKLSINNWRTIKSEVPVIGLIDNAKAKLLKDYQGFEFEI